jgi:ketosteroid isomerase-like protein
MSRRKSEIFRASHEAWNRGDFDAVFQDADPDIVVRPDPSWPEGVAHGTEAARALYEDIAQSWGPRETVLEELAETHDQVIARFRYPIHGGHSGVEGEFTFTMVATFREGKMILIETFFDHARALEAVGLSEQDVHGRSP